MGFSVGDRVKVIDFAQGDDDLFSVGDVGTVALVHPIYGHIYVKFDDGQNITEHGNYIYTQLTGQNCRLVYAMQPYTLMHIPAEDAGYYKPGDNGWIPDRLAEGIDVIKITKDLVSQEVGK